MSGHEVRVTELSCSGRKCYRTICGKPGQKSKDKAVPQIFPNLSALSLVISLTHLPHDPPSSSKPTTGRGRFASRQSYNCSYQAYILTMKKIAFIPNPARGLQPSASIWEGSSGSSQTVLKPTAWISLPGWYSNGTSPGVCRCCHPATQASVLHSRNASTLLQVTLKKNPKLGKLRCQTAPWTQLLPFV